MSNQITTAFTKQFQANVELLTQQMGSKLRGTVRIEPQKGEEKFFERIGATTAQEITTRHGDSPQVDTPHDRRRVTLRFFDWGDFVDDPDKIQMLIDPTSAYAQNAAAAMGRQIDDLIIEAQFGSAWTGKTGTTEVTFPAGQQIAVNFGGSSVNLTLAKLIESRRLFLGNDVDLDMPGNELHIGVTDSQIAALLNDSTLTSADYNSVRALVRGEIDTFLGMKFHHTQRIGVDGSAYRRVPVWATSGVLLSLGIEVQAKITERADKRFSTYVYVRMGFGSTRMEEVKVVEVLCDES